MTFLPRSLLLLALTGCAANRTALGGGVVASTDGAGPGFALSHERISGRIGYGGGLVTERRAFDDATDWRTGLSLFARAYAVRKTTSRWLSGDRSLRARDCTETDKVCVERRKEQYAVGLGIRLDGLVVPSSGDLIPSAAAELHARYSAGTPFFASADLGYELEPDHHGPVARILVGVALYIDFGYPTPQIGGRRIELPEF